MTFAKDSPSDNIKKKSPVIDDREITLQGCITEQKEPLLLTIQKAEVALTKTHAKLFYFSKKKQHAEKNFNVLPMNT